MEAKLYQEIVEYLEQELTNAGYLFTEIDGVFHGKRCGFEIKTESLHVQTIGILVSDIDLIDSDLDLIPIGSMEAAKALVKRMTK